MNTIRMRDLTWVVIDTETTGLNPSDGARMLEIAMVRLEPGTLEVSDVFTTLVNPGVPVAATEIHRITQGEIDIAPSFLEVAPAISARLEGCVVVGHNVSFDWKFLSAEYSLAGLEIPSAPLVCTLEGARQHLPLERHRLGMCCEHLGISLEGWHAALADTMATAELAKRLLDLAEAKGKGKLADQAWYSKVIKTEELPQVRVAARN